MFQDQMVFQRAPHSPMIWGYGTPGKEIRVEVIDANGVNVTKNTESVFVKKNEEFEINLGSFEPGSGYNIIVREVLNKNQSLTVELLDVAFGDVWICTGQSNMMWRVKDIRDGEAEIAKAVGYEDIRLLKTAREFSDHPLLEPKAFENNWSKPHKDFLANGDSFSGFCLIFGEQLYDQLNIPIGLIESSWGATRIETWSPPDSLASCEIKDTGAGKRPENHHEYLWNGMIHPYLRFSIKGVIWYQGEQNAGYPDSNYVGHNRELYFCTFPKLIDNWRKHWARKTNGDVDRKFPFGFMQLGPFTDQRENFAWPELRWQQTAGYGFAPNDVLENVFMATAIDSDIQLHPTNKRLPATRLSWAALNLVYGNISAPIRGPHPMKVSFKATDRKKIIIIYDQEIAKVPKEADRFMICCSESLEDCDKTTYGYGWQGVDIVGNIGKKSLELDTSSSSCPSNYSGIAYLWLETPCSAETACPVYSNDEYRLPALPWRQEVKQSSCAMEVAYTGDHIKIVQTGEMFLITADQEDCHRACLVHPECEYYAWYDAMSLTYPGKCFLQKNKKIKMKENFLQFGSKTCHTRDGNV